MAIIRDPETGNYYNTDSGEHIAKGLTGQEGHNVLMAALAAEQQVGVSEQSGWSAPAAAALDPTFEPDPGRTFQHTGGEHADEAGFKVVKTYQEWGSAHIGTDPNVLYQVEQFSAPGRGDYWHRTPISNKTVETTRQQIRDALGKTDDTTDATTDDTTDDTTTTTTTTDTGGAFDAAGGYYNDLLELQALELAANTQLQRDAQALQRELGFAGFDVDLAGQKVQRDIAEQQSGLSVLDLALRNRGPENAIQYSNLSRGLAEGERDYPAILRRVARMKNAGTRTANPFLGMVNLNQLPDEAVGSSPGILRAYNPYQVSLQELNRLSSDDFDLLINSLEAAGGSGSQYAAAIDKLMPRAGRAAGGRAF